MTALIGEATVKFGLYDVTAFEEREKLQRNG